MASCLVGTLSSSRCAAQRGQDYVRQDLPLEGPSSGFPGVLDTELAKPKSVVIQAPAATLHVGITENLTLGTNLIYDAISATGNVGGLGWARYRVRGTARLQSTLDIIGGGFRIYDGGDDARHVVVVGISNTSLQLAPRHRITFSLLGGNVALGLHGSDSVDVSATGIAAGIGYLFTAARWCALSATVAPVPVLVGHVEDSSTRADVNYTSASQTLARTFYRAFVLLRAGRHWSFELGAFGVGKSVLPWLSVGLKTR